MQNNFDIIKMFLPTRKILRGLKNASYLTIGHILSIIINFFGFIYIARFLGPSNYGVYSTVGAFVGLFGILTFIGLGKVVLREGSKDLKTMSYFIEKTIGVKILFTFIAINVCIIVSIFMPYTSLEKFYIIIYSFTLIYYSFEGFLGTIYQAAEKMQYNAALVVLNRVLFVPLSITLLYLGFGLISLFIMALFSQFLTLIINYRLTKRFLSYKFINKIEWDRPLLTSGLFFSILSFSVFLRTKIDIVMISILGTPRDVGIYGVPFNIVQTVLILRNILAVAFYPIFVKYFHNKRGDWRKIVKYSLLLGISILIIALIGSIFSIQIITILFGDEYFESGVILSVLIFYIAFAFFNIPFSNTLQATHNEKNLLKITWIGPSLNIILNYFLFNIYGLIGIAYSTLIVTIIMLFITINYSWILLKKQNKIY